MSTVKELVKEIKSGLTQVSSSGKDEVKVMREMLNDAEYKVGIYSKEGKVGEYCPAEDARTMIANVVASTTKINKEEAEKLAVDYKFKNSDAQTFINVSKEFVNTYLQTGRKLPLGGRETSDIAFAAKEVKETTKTYPKKVGIDESGKAIYEHSSVKIPKHESVRTFASAPEWVK